MEYIELNRRLRVLTDEEHDQRAYLDMIEHPHFIKGDSWDDVLKSRLIVVLAEAGSGKTEELRHQCKRLRMAGRHAWLLPIERLSGDKLLDLLSEEPGERESFETWLADGTAGEATLFLDAVDELKLVHGNLATALGKVVSATGAERRRLRIVLSCRPSDWQPGADRELLIRRFPQPVEQDEVLERPPDEEFRLGLAGLRAKREKAEVAAPDLQVAVLLPLDAHQIRTVARSLGVTDVDAFLEEIDQRDAWIFTRRPLDLIEVIQVWNAKARLGTRLEQHAANVDISLKDRPNRPDGNLLSPEHSRLGAQRLALALFRIGARTLRAPEHTLTADRSGDAVSAGDILADWPDDRVNALLRRPIFDPATYGRVKFHHRSTQEYLAALELKRLLAKGLPIRQVLDLLTADTYGEEILVPSLRPLSAWLALWDQHTCKAVLAREPEVLLQYGDPESLPPAAKIELLRSFVAHYGGGSWRGLQIPTGEVKRLASPALANEIRTLWATQPENEEARSFLVKLIWLGDIGACYDLAEEAALSDGENQTVRILGVRSLGLENGARLRSVVADILRNPGRWPARVIQNSAAEIWKAGPAVNDFVNLVAATPEPSNVTSGFGWSLFNLATELDPFDPRAAELAQGLTRLIRSGRTPSDWFHISSRLSYLAPALKRLSEKLLKNAPVADRFVEGAVVAVRFSHGNTLGREDNMGLTQLIQGRIEWRRQAFWAEIALYTDRDGAELRQENSYVVLHDSVLGHLEAQDWGWLLTDLQASDVPETRAFLCEQLIHLWWRCGERPEQRARLLWAVVCDAALSERAALQTIRHPPDPALAEMNRERADWEAQRAAEAKRDDEDWDIWRAELLADPAGAFSGEKKGWHAHNLLNWVGKTTDRDNKIAIAEFEGIRRAFSDQVFDLLLAFLADYWRNDDPPVLSKRPPEKHGSITTGTTWALTGLGWESTINPAWTNDLPEVEARRAAGWATLEMNGFPAWLSVLAVPHAGVVREVLLAELDGEIANVETVVHPRVIADLRQGPEVLRSLLHTDLVDRLEALSLPADGAASGYAVSNLAQLIGVAAQDNEGIPDARLAALCSARFSAAPLGRFALIWLTGLARQELQAAVALLRATIGSASPDERAKIGVPFFGALFGDRDLLGGHISLDRDAALLVDLTRLAYDCVRRADDEEHEGVFTPGERDNAESARNRILGALIGRPGEATHAALLAIAREQLFEHMPDRLRMEARQRAAADSEPALVTPQEYRRWESRFEQPPQNPEELFAVMLDRLGDIYHDIQADDFSDRQTLHKVEREEEMQPLLAAKIRAVARGAYNTTREEEVVNKKETDFRFHATAYEGRGVVELKIGDNWSVRELEEAISSQMINQYLCHRDCSVGVLLVTYAGRKGFRHPDTGQKMSFMEVIAHLRDHGATIEASHGSHIRIGVVGYDLRGLRAATTPA